METEMELFDSNNAPGGGLSRRDLLKIGGVSALAGAGLLGGLTGCSAASDTTEDAASQWDHEADVVVIGSGAGGFTAALRTAQEGPKTVLVEISNATGGASSWCGGIIYCAAGPDEAAMSKFTQKLAGKLGMNYGRDHGGWMDWLVESNLAVADCAAGVHTAPQGTKILSMGWKDGLGTYGCREFFDSFEDEFERAGGTLLMETRGEKIITDEEDNILGLRCRDKEGGVIKVKAKAVVIATGGFQNNEGLRHQYLGPEAGLATVCASPYCTGSGLLMAQEVGAATSGQMSGFSATLAPAYPAVNYAEIPEDYEQRDYSDGDNSKAWLYRNLISNVSPQGSMYVNLDGHRFIDEGERVYRVHQHMVRQKRSTAIMIADNASWQTWLKSTPSYGLPDTAESNFAEAILSEKTGGALFSADTIEELADKLNETNIATYMINKENLVKTFNEYNAALAQGSGASLDIPRAGELKPLTEPPFYAYPIRPAIYSTWGGIAINERAQVLDKNDHPIKGLYAAAPAAGGIMREIYTGAVAMSGTSGWWAANAIVEDIASM